MTFDCNKIQLKQGSKGGDVKELQAILTSMKLYDGKIDGDYGEVTADAVQKLQARLGGLLVDGVFGKQTCTKLREYQNKEKDNGIYTNYKLCEQQGGDCLGQITGYHCGPHSIKQALRKFGITGYSESTIGGWAGTTTAGTGHGGLETAIAVIARKEGVKLNVTWKNFSDLGSTRNERFKALGKIMNDPNKTFFLHLLYKGKYGHYESLKTINTTSNGLVVPNSLGYKCRSPAYCGYMENRSFGTEQSSIAGISQKSVCIITKSF